MAIIVKNPGYEDERVVGSYCLGILEIEGVVYPAQVLEDVRAMGYGVLYIS